MTNPVSCKRASVSLENLGKLLSNPVIPSFCKGCNIQCMIGKSHCYYQSVYSIPPTLSFPSGLSLYHHHLDFLLLHLPVLNSCSDVFPPPARKQSVRQKGNTLCIHTNNDTWCHKQVHSMVNRSNTGLPVSVCIHSQCVFTCREEPVELGLDFIYIKVHTTQHIKPRKTVLSM